MLTNQMKRKAIILIIIAISSAFILTACQKETVTEEPEIIATPLTMVPDETFSWEDR